MQARLAALSGRYDALASELLGATVRGVLKESRMRNGLGIGCLLAATGLSLALSCSSGPERDYGSNTGDAGAAGETVIGTAGNSAGTSGTTNGGTHAGGAGAEAGAGGIAPEPEACEPGAVENCWEGPNGEAFDAEQPTELFGACLLGERKCDEDR